MKKGYVKALRAPVLLLLLASTASAGDIQHPAVPPAPAGGEIQHPTATGAPATPDAARPRPGVDALAESALNLLGSVLHLF